MSDKGIFTGCCACDDIFGRGSSDTAEKSSNPMLLLIFVAAIVSSAVAVIWLPALAAGIVCGISAAMVGVFLMMPKMMILTHKSRYSVDETVERLTQAIEQEGWSVPAVRDFNKSMAEKGVEFARPVKLVELCKAEYASEVLKGNRHLLTMMPCAFGVYEDDQGNVHVSGMNTSLMGKMFGGKVAEIMGGKVAADEKKILKAVC